MYFELFTKKKNEYLKKWVAGENKRVKYSMLQQLLGKNNVVLTQSLWETESLEKSFNAFFSKKIEAVLFLEKNFNAFFIKKIEAVLVSMV